MLEGWRSWWMAYLVLALGLPILYGWGYRGWGPPLPSYVQSRRQRQAGAARLRGSAVVFNHRAWGRAGDVMWLLLAGGLVWTVGAHVGR